MTYKTKQAIGVTGILLGIVIFFIGAFGLLVNGIKTMKQAQYEQCMIEYHDTKFCQLLSK